MYQRIHGISATRMRSEIRSISIDPSVDKRRRDSCRFLQYYLTVAEVKWYLE